MRLVTNFILFQLAWFACVLGAAYLLPWVGPLVVAGVVSLHLAKVPERRAETALLLVVGLLGALFDSLLVSSGWLQYPSGQWGANLAPYWIVAMWVAFGTTLNVSLHWLKGRPLLAAMLGAVGGPLAYYGGAGLGGVSLVDAPSALTALAIGWAVMMPLLLVIASRLDGWRPGVGGRALPGAAGGSRNA